MQSSDPVLLPPGKIGNRPASPLWTDTPAPACLWLIGRMEAWTAGGVSILPTGRKTRALLAILALRAPRPVSRSYLADLLWSQRPEEQARASLRQEIHRLLEALQPAGHDIVRVARDHLSLRTDGAWVDVHEVLHATVADSSALGLFDAELLENLNGIDPAFDRWLAAERDSLRDQARAVVETLLADQAEPAATIEVATRLLAIDRAHEGAWRALMRAHAVRGERGLALQTFERCKAALAERLSASVSLETLDLAAEIRAGALRPDKTGAGSPAQAPGAARIGVLPLQVIGTDGGAATLALGLAAEVAVALARFRWLVVVAASSLTRPGHRDDDALGRVFGLDFLLDGSVQWAGHFRITLRLLDLRDGRRVVWARRFDRDAANFLDLQDELAAEVAAQIEPELLSLESRSAAGRLERRRATGRLAGRRAAAHPTREGTAYDLVLRALPMTVRLQREEFAQAGALLAQALDLQPDYAAAHAWRAYWAMFCVTQGWEEGPGVADEAKRHAECAITLDPQDARGLTIAGHVRAFLHRRPHEALDLHSRALSLNPNLTMAWGFSAMTFSYLGEWDEAARRYARTARLSPAAPCTFLFDAGMARVELGRRDYPAAVQWGRRVSEAAPQYLPGLKHHLAALGHSGLASEADATRARLLALAPGYTIRTAIECSPYEHAADMEHYAAGLRLAGLP